MTFGRRIFFYLLFLSVLASSCASVKAFLQPASPPSAKSKDYYPPGPKAEAYYHFLLSQVYQHSGQIDKALQEYQKALEDDPASAFLHSDLAAIYLKQGLPEKALKEAEKAIQTDPQSLPAHLLLGGLYLSLNQRDKAIQTVSRLQRATRSQQLVSGSKLL